MMLSHILLLTIAIASVVVGQDPCTLCPDGSDPIYDSQSDIGFQCSSVEASLPILSPDSEECLGIQESPLPALCGCPGLTGETCSFCPNGGMRGEPLVDKETSAMLGDCDLLEAFVPFLSGDNCTELQESTLPALCGCDVAGFVPCRFCGEGQVAFPTDGSSSNAATCQGYESTALLLGSAESSACSDFLQQVVSQDCQCIQGEVGVPCPGVCPDGSTPLQPNFAPEGLSGTTCGEWNNFIQSDSGSSVLQESDQCEAYQTFALVCGCPNVEPCAGLCSDGSIPLATDLPVVNELVNGTTCGDLDTALQTQFASTSDICGNVDLQIFCQCPGVEICPGICPDGQVPLNDEFMIPFFGDGTNITCQDLHAFASSMAAESEICDELQELRLACECPGVEPLCSLCEDGSMIPDPTLEVGMDLGTCAQVQAFFALEDENCTTAQGIVGTYCGCTNPIADSEICRICGQDTWLPEPGIEVFFFDELVPCGQIEFIASGGLPAQCAQFQANYSVQCCGGILTTSPGPTTSPEPTSAPSLFPITPMPIMSTPDPTSAPVVVPDPTPAPLETAGPTFGIPTPGPTPSPVVVLPTPGPALSTPAPIEQTEAPTSGCGRANMVGIGMAIVWGILVLVGVGVH